MDVLPGGVKQSKMDEIRLLFTHLNRDLAPSQHPGSHYCTRRADRSNTVYNVYTNIPGSYKTLSHSHFGQSDHISLFLLPAY